MADNSTACAGDIVPPSDPLFYAFLFGSIALILASGLFSGLTLGMMSQERLGLRVLMESGKPKERQHARKIYPLLDSKHVLLVTLVLCNSAVALSLPLTLDRIVPAWAAIIVSVTGILVFGEVLPQAICSRHALAIGAFFAKPVRLLMYVFLPISWPLAKLLDNMLGTSDGDFLRRDEMATFIGLHESGALDSKGSNEEPLVTSEVRVLKGALGLSGKCAMDVATPIDHVFSLKTDTVLNRQQVEEIIDRGFSRVPLHKGDDPTMLTSYLLVKSLALVDPAARVPLNAASGARTRDLPRAPSDMPLYDLMALFQSQHAHMAGLYAPGDTSGAVVAVVTLEDLLEELVGTEIVDETDIFVDVVKSIRVVNAFRRGRKGGNGGAIGSAARNRLHSDDSAGSAQVAQTMLDQAAAAEGATGGTQVSIV